MIPVDEARRRLLEQTVPLGAERVPLVDALGRVLAADVFADIDLPPFDHVTVDGYAVRASDVAHASEESPVLLRVVEEVPSGAAPTRLVDRGEAVAVAAGVPLPSGADAAVPEEHGELRESGSGERAVAVSRPARMEEHVRRRGSQAHEGESVLAEGKRVSPAAVGLLAEAGADTVRVRRRPRVGILSTGEELVATPERPTPGKTRDVTGWTLAAQVALAGGVAAPLGLASDAPEDIRRHVEGASGLDVVLTSGGAKLTEEGRATEALASLGRLESVRVDMRPRVVLTFGIVDGRPFIGLPGDPVTCMVAFELFVRPVLRTLQGLIRLDRPEVTATLTHDVRKQPHRPYYLRGKLEQGGRIGHTVTLLPGRMKGLASMHRANCIVSLPEGESQFPTGSPVSCLRLDVEEGTP